MKILIVAISLALIFPACKKKTTSETAACEKEGWGILKVNFGASSTRHSILVTIPGTSSFIEKIVPIGQSSDTMHLSNSGKYNGVAYPINISSIDNLGAAIDQKNDSRSIGNCLTTEITVSF